MILSFRVNLARMDLLVPQELLDSLGKLVSQDQPASQVKLDLPEHLENTVYLVMLEKKAHRVLLVRKENKDPLVLQDSRVSQARGDLPAFQYDLKCTISKKIGPKYALI